MATNAKQKKFIGITLVELGIAAGVIILASIFVFIFIYPERRAAQERNMERGKEMQVYLTALRSYQKDDPDAATKLIETIPLTAIEIGACTTCFDLANHLGAQYLDDLPADPHVLADEQTGYYLYRDDQGFIYVMAPHAEVGLDLIDKESFL